MKSGGQPSFRGRTLKFLMMERPLFNYMGAWLIFFLIMVDSSGILRGDGGSVIGAERLNPHCPMKFKILFSALLFAIIPSVGVAGETAAGTVIEISGIGSFVIFSSLFLSWKEMPSKAKESILNSLRFWKR